MNMVSVKTEHVCVLLDGTGNIVRWKAVQIRVLAMVSVE